LTLLEEGGRCILDTEGPNDRRGRLLLSFGGACGFVTDGKDNPLMHEYSDVGLKALVIVGEMQQGCGPASQGVLIGGSGVALSVRVARGGPKCPSAGMDEKEFWLFAHP
jgi:hypothetical protein